MTLCTDRNISWEIDWDELTPIGEGAEQACYAMWDNPNVVVKMPHHHRDVEDLIEGTISAEDQGVGPKWHAFVVNDEDTIIGVIVDKCLTYEDLKEELEAWCHAENNDKAPLCPTRDDINEILHALDEDADWAYELLVKASCLLPEVELLGNLIDACQMYDNRGYKDMHYGNVGMDERGDWLIIDTAGYFMNSD